MPILQNYSLNCSDKNMQNTTFNPEQEQTSIDTTQENISCDFIDFKYLFNLMNEQDSVYFEEGENEKEEPFLPELQNHQFEQETPIVFSSLKCTE